MQDISRMRTRWTFEDNKEEDIKDGTMHSTQLSSRTFDAELGGYGEQPYSGLW